MSSINRLQDYESFKSECTFFECQMIYEGDWDGRERYIVASDTPEDVLLRKYPEIMKNLSPYFFVSAECGEIYAESWRNISKFKKRTSNTVYFGDEDGEEHDYPIASFVDKYMRCELLQSAMQVLSPLQKEYIQLYFLEGLKFKEISVMTGRDASTVKKTIDRGLERLRAYICENS